MTKLTFFTVILLNFFLLVSCAETVREGRSVSAYVREVNGDIQVSYGSDAKIVRLSEFDPAADSYKPVDTGDPVLAEDKQTLGWTVEYENCCTSYPIPTVLVLYRAGNIIQRLQNGQMIWNWRFWNRGDQIVLQTGPTHGDQCAYYLRDAETGRVLDEKACDDLPLPDWAISLEDSGNH